MISMKILRVCIFRVHCIYNIFPWNIRFGFKLHSSIHIIFYCVCVSIWTLVHCSILCGAFPHVQTHLRVYNIHSGGVVVFTQACILLSILITIIGRACSQMAAFEHIYSGIDCKLIWQWGRKAYNGPHTHTHTRHHQLEHVFIRVQIELAIFHRHDIR